MKHIFAIAAYGDSPYLEACIRSVTGQSVASDAIICTSTPSEYINDIADKYDIPVYVREGESNIAADWNFAYEMADADLVTIAHQDDMYSSDYVKELLEAKYQYPDMSLFTCSSRTVKNGRLICMGLPELVKKLLRIPLRNPEWNHLGFVKKAALRFGNPIICPGCTYDKDMCGYDLFDESRKFILDWEALYKLADKPGRFICNEKDLIMYRVHGDATTAKLINNHVREEEEAEMFDRVLPKWLAGPVSRLYRKSYDAYK